MEKSVMTQPEVATEEIGFSFQISVVAYKSSQGSHNFPKWGCCLEPEKHHSHVSTFLISLPSWMISSNLPVQPLRQQHFCTEQQLQHLCECRPFDVLRVDDTQRCFTQTGGGGKERDDRKELEAG